MAPGGLGRRLWVPLQIQRRLSAGLLGRFLSPSAGGARPSKTAWTLSGVADFHALHTAGHHLERPAWLDHGLARRSPGGSEFDLAADLEVVLGFFIRQRRAL